MKLKKTQSDKNSKTEIFTKLNNSNCDETKKTQGDKLKN